MKIREFLKDNSGLIMIGLIDIILIFAYCGTGEERKSRTVDEIIIENRQIRADTTDTTIVK